MAWTKRQFIEAAFEEIGLASYVFDLSPEQLEGALRRLDTMMASWNVYGVRLGYPLPDGADGSDLDQDSGVPDSANEAIITNLAIRIAPGYGKTVSGDTKLSAKSAYRALLNISTMPPEMQLPSTMPAGAGQKPWRNVENEYLNRPTDPLLAGNDGEIELN